MPEKKKLFQSIDEFSKKFSKLNEEDKDRFEIPLSKDKILQDEITRQEEEREADLRRRFSDFLEPRTQDIEEDEENLLQAYELFCKLNEVCKLAEKENCTARLRSLEISSPLCKRDDYTLGENLAFLRLWFLQKNPDAEVVPFFLRDDDGYFYLDFADKKFWKPNSLEKELLRILI